MLARPLDTDSFSVAGSHKSHKSSASKGSKASRATSRSSKASKRGHKKDVANEEPVIVEEPKQPFDLDLVGRVMPPAQYVLHHVCFSYKQRELKLQYYMMSVKQEDGSHVRID